MSYIDFREKRRWQRVDFDKFYRFQCFTENNFVLTKWWIYKDIKDIKIWDEVYNYTWEFLNKVINVFSEIKETIKIWLWPMWVITTTVDHPFYCKKLLKWWNDIRHQKYLDWNWILAKEIKKYDMLMLSNYKHELSIKLSHDELFFLWYWLWDGTITKNAIRICSCNKNKKYEKIMSLDINLKTYEYKNQEWTFDHMLVNRNHEQLHKLIMSIGTWMDKQIPLIFGIEEYKIIIDWYLSADWCLYQNKKDHYRAQTICKRLALSITYASLVCWYATNIKELKKNAIQYIQWRKVNCHPLSYHIIISKSNWIRSNLTHDYDNAKRVICKSTDENKELNTVYNITTDGDNTYSINNIWVHNCVDLIRQYALEVFKIQLPSSWWSAKLRWLSNWWKHKKIPNTPEWVPQQWDIIFFDATPRNSFWHVWIVESADVNTVVVLDQNGWIWKWNWIAWDEIQLRKFNYIRPRCLWRIRLTSKK